MRNFCVKFLSAVLTFGATMGLSAQENPVIFTVADDTVNEKEFRYIYEKNNSDAPGLYTKASVQDYLDLYINFKLKVKAAREAGLDTTEKYLNEFEDYRKQLSEPYLKDTSKLNELLSEAYQRMQEERNVSHVLIKVPHGAPSKDTTKAYNRAMEVYKKVKNGEMEFEEAARTYSEDEHTKNRGGELGYFSVFDMVYPFENVAYQLEEGEISRPFRTKFGYHVLKLNDKRPYRGHIKTAHIMLQADQSDEEKWESAKQQIDSIYKALQNGAGFEKMVRQYSDDRRSKQNQGKMPEFGSLSRHLPKKFRDEAFSLEKDGAISEPFHTQYGWHILKRIEKRGVDDFEKARSNLKEQLKQDQRHDLIRESVVERIEKEYDHRFFKKHYRSFKTRMDSSLLEGKWEPDFDQIDKKILYQIEDQTFSTHDFAKYLSNKQKGGNYQFLSYAVDKYWADFKRKKLIAFERNRLEEKYPEFRNLLTEYKEGILLFEITDQKVWSKAIEDTSGLKAYYQENKKEYRQPKRKEAAVLSCNDKQMAREIESQLKETDQRAASWYDNADKDFKEKCEFKEGTYPVTEHKAVKKAKDKPGIYRVRAGKQHHVVEVQSVEPEGVAELSEIRGKVIADYQNHLEEKWIESLKNQYQVKVNEEAVESLYRK